METPDLLIHARWLALPHTETLLEDHVVAIRDGNIVDILPATLAHNRYAQAREWVTLPQHVLMPGLINLHTHAAMTLLRGIADDLPFMEWLHQHIWPAEARLVSPQFVYDGTLLACAEMLKGGVTCFNDMYFFLDEAAAAVAESGIRAALGITALEFPNAWARNADEYLEKGLATRERWQRHPNLSFCLAPHAPYSVVDTSFVRIRDLAAQLDLPIHLHIHETEAEIREHEARHGCRPLRRLEALGLLTPRLIGVHAVHLDTGEIALLAQRGCHIAHCPTSNLKLGSGIAPLAALLEAGVNVGLGTDGAASNNRLDLFQEMRLASLLAKGFSRDAGAVPAWKALRMATCNAARALGLGEKTGTLATGYAADLIAVDLDALELHPCFDPVSHLVHCAGREHVSHVWVGGKCCVSAKQGSILPAKLKQSACFWHNSVNHYSDPRQVTSTAESDMIKTSADFDATGSD
ncbi:MAG: TRZ/ATZ family hydrolase [Zoogloeaceae bacterium]|jgi:5-methylthioadenosine/S-adenosylhomocysteine deaminase|nr:TRZ/ATZ family hydrolase [Zoogloeaceae bacterium]